MACLKEARKEACVVRGHDHHIVQYWQPLVPAGTFLSFPEAATMATTVHSDAFLLFFVWWIQCNCWSGSFGQDILKSQSCALRSTPLLATYTLKHFFEIVFETLAFSNWTHFTRNIVITKRKFKGTDIYQFWNLNNNCVKKQGFGSPFEHTLDIYLPKHQDFHFLKVF